MPHSPAAKATATPRIMISRLSHVGDCVLTLPVLNALREQFPDAFIAWVVEPPADQLLTGHPALDELIVVQRGWMKSPRHVLQIRKQLRSLRIEVTIDPQSLSKSAVAAWLTGAKHRIGFAAGVGRELAPWLNRTCVKPRTLHLVDRSLELLSPLGVATRPAAFGLPRNAAAEDTVRQFLNRVQLPDTFAVICPGAGWHSRRWQPARYGQLAHMLGRSLGVPSVVAWAGDAECQWAKQIVELSGGQALLAPPTNLCELAALLRSSHLYVGSDSGPLHMAAAVGTPCVGLYGTTKVEHSGPYGPRHIAVQAYYQAGGSRERRKADNVAMRAIQCDEVFESCKQQLAQRGSRAA